MKRTVHQPTGWNTWDFRGFNRLVYLKAGRTVAIVQFAIWDETFPAPRPPPDPEHRKIGRLYDSFRWEDVTRLGPHAPLGLPAVLEFKARDIPYRAEAFDHDGRLELTVTPLAETVQRVVFQFIAPVGEAVVPTSPARGTFAECDIRLSGCTWPSDYFVNIAEPYAVAAAGRPATILVTPPNGRRRKAAATGPGTLKKLERQALVGEGALADAPQAMMQAVCWNTLYDARRRLVSSPVSRDWCYDWRGVLVFCWDTYLVGTFMSYETPELARMNFDAVNAAIDELGHVPNYYMAHGAASRDRSMPPLGSYMIWKTQRLAPDKAWLGQVYPRLTRWHAYWLKHRDGNGNGLLSWGSNNVAYEFPQLVPYNQKLQHTRQSAMYESGLDNSPMFDDVEFDPQTCCLKLDDVALSSYYAMDCEALAAIAACLGKPREAAGYRREYEQMAARINELLWDEERGIYCNRHWDGRLSNRWSPTSFFPLIAGVAPLDRAQRMVREHLLNEQEFWGPYVLPSIARNDPAHKDNDYWRGRIWGPFNFLVSEGLRRYRLDTAAAELAKRGLDMFMMNYREDGGVYENYNADTGRGADVWNAARLYHWGGLLAFIAMQELIDVEPAGYLRLGSQHFGAAGLRHVRLGNCLFDIHQGSGLRVQRDGELFLECSTPALVRLPLSGPADEPIAIWPVGGSGRLALSTAAAEFAGSNATADSGSVDAKRSGRRASQNAKRRRARSAKSATTRTPRLLRLPDGRTVTPTVTKSRVVYTW